MPRQPRLDAPGLLHHVMARGIEGRDIFLDSRDRLTFLDRLGELVTEGRATLYAWALMANHVHLVVRTGDRPLSWLMRRLATRHAVRFNLRHDREGHLFQNRFRSLVVEAEEYLLELVRYVALNPVRSGTVGSLDQLDTYPWNGHSVLVGKRAAPWQETDEVLGRFGAGRADARRGYRAFVAAGWDQGRRDELVGGAMRGTRPGEEVSDPRVLGTERFVEEVWRMVGTPAGHEPPRDWAAVLSDVAAEFRLSEQRILGPSRERLVSAARREFWRRAAETGHCSWAELARISGVGPTSVRRGAEKARAERGLGRPGQQSPKSSNVP